MSQRMDQYCLRAQLIDEAHFVFLLYDDLLSVAEGCEMPF